MAAIKLEIDTAIFVLRNRCPQTGRRRICRRARRLFLCAIKAPLVIRIICSGKEREGRPEPLAIDVPEKNTFQQQYLARCFVKYCAAAATRTALGCCEWRKLVAVQQSP
ncbi:MAG: hypothetical protein LBI92_03020 [Azoarcus sp.]|nr:hypothetical protein [Azoarcus sp.]